jgi:hypothetical protein
MKLLDVIIAAEGRVCSGAKYMWNCWGDHARFMEFADADGLPFCDVVFDTKTYDVYDIQLFVPGTDQCFKWINPEFKDALFQESKVRNVDPFTAWDDVWFDEITDITTLMTYIKDIAATYYDDLPIPENI